MQWTVLFLSRLQFALTVSAGWGYRCRISRAGGAELWAHLLAILIGHLEPHSFSKSGSIATSHHRWRSGSNGAAAHGQEQLSQAVGGRVPNRVQVLS